MSKRKTTREFVMEAVEKHGDKYDYSEVDYINNSTKVVIICPAHGEFLQRPYDHLTGGCGCPKCKYAVHADQTKSNTAEFIAKALKKHNGAYSYENVMYENAKAKVSITCPIHGDFDQTPNDHLTGYGCRHCRTDSIGWTSSKWKTQGEQSNSFKGYMLYIVKIFDSNESFIKIGKTFVGIESRFKDIASMYNYKVLHTIEADADTISKLEKKCQRINMEYAYSPKVKFNGHTECFSQIEVEGVTYE